MHRAGMMVAQQMVDLLKHAGLITAIGPIGGLEAFAGMDVVEGDGAFHMPVQGGFGGGGEQGRRGTRGGAQNHEAPSAQHRRSIPGIIEPICRAPPSP